MSPEDAVVIIVIGSLLGCLLSIPNLLVQLHARNRAVSTLVVSVLLYNLLRSINAIVWRSADRTTWWDGRVYCDIEIKLSGGLEMAISGSPACIFFQLNTILEKSDSILGLSKRQRRRILIVDVMLLAVLPVARMALSYLVQPYRYVIVGVWGCSQPVDSSWPTYALWLLWPLAICMVGVVMAAQTTYQLYRHHRETTSALNLGRTAASKSRIRRMFTLAMVLLLLILPYMIHFVYSQRIMALMPYSWSTVHPPNWSSSIYMIAIRITPQLFLSALWQAATSVVIFACFGWGHDARQVYRRWGQQFKRLLSRIRISKGNATPLTTSTSGPELRQLPRDFECELEALPSSRGG